jgi:hypothetical protein
VVEMILDYDGKRIYVCAIVEFEDGKIKRDTRARLSLERRAPPCWPVLVASSATQNLPRVTL